MADPNESRPRYWLEPVCRRLAFAIPLLVAVFRTSPSTQWRDDLAAVRELGLIPVGTEGLVSTLLAQIAAVVPVGGRLLRAGWVSAIGLACCAVLIYLIARRLLEASSETPRLTPPLALASALTATLGPSWQLEGTIAGGVTVACALVLLGIRVALTRHPRLPDARASSQGPPDLSVAVDERQPAVAPRARVA